MCQSIRFPYQGIEFPDDGKEKRKFVIFEGCDKSGKTTLFKMYRRATQYIPLAIDRFTGSNFVYDRYYDRDTYPIGYLAVEEDIQKLLDCYLVLLKAPEDVIRGRILREEDEKAAKIALGNFRAIQGLFLMYYRDYTRYQKKILLDTGILTPEQCLSIILGFTGEVQSCR